MLEGLIMPTRNVFLSEHFDDFIAAGIETGRYSNASEVVRDGLRLLEQREQEDRAKIEWLRTAAQGAVDSLERGVGKTFGSVGELNDHLRHLARHASTRAHDGELGG